MPCRKYPAQCPGTKQADSVGCLCILSCLENPATLQTAFLPQCLRRTVKHFASANGAAVWQRKRSPHFFYLWIEAAKAVIFLSPRKPQAMAVPYSVLPLGTGKLSGVPQWSRQAQLYPHRLKALPRFVVSASHPAGVLQGTCSFTGIANPDPGKCSGRSVPVCSLANKIIL